MVQKIRAIIFDADNTLYTINNNRAYHDMYRYLAEKLNEKEESVRIRHKGMVEKIRHDLDPKRRDYAHTLKALLESYDSDTKDMIDEALKIFWDRIIADLEEKDTSIITIIELDEMGKYKLAIASDEFRPNLDRKLKKIFGPWHKAFTEIITPEDTNTMKPSEEYYRIALKRLGTKPGETVMVGDSWLRDLAPAKRLGMITVLLDPESKSPDIHPKKGPENQKYTISKPDYTIGKMIHLKKILQKCES